MSIGGNTCQIIKTPKDIFHKKRENNSYVTTIILMPSVKPRITIRVSEAEMEELQQAANEEYRTVPSLVLTIVKKFLDERRKNQNNSSNNHQLQK